jgi:hypothetical protein
MVNEINVIGVGSAQGLAYASSASQVAVKEPAERASRTSQAPTVEQDVRVQGIKGGFPALASLKDDAVQAARSIRDAGKAIADADNLASQMRQKVQVVKNYPPFPPGNQDRMNFINSIEGLRKQLEALQVPPVERENGPVFYPKESNLPVLDVLASDAKVEEFGQAVEAVQRRINAGYAELQSQAARITSRFSVDLPQPPREDEVMQAGSATAAQLATVSQPLVSNSAVLAQMDG